MTRTVATGLFTVMLCGAGVAQTWQPVDKNVLMAKLDASAKKFAAMPAYRVNSTISAYQNSSDAQPTERGTSEVWKVGDKAKAQHLGMVSYQNKKLRVSIDPEEKLLMLAEPQDFFSPLGPDYRTSVFEAAITIGRATSADGERYRAKFPAGGDFEIIEFGFDKAGWLRRVETHWGHQVAVMPDNPMTAMITPKVVLEMAVPQKIAANSVAADPTLVVTIQNGKPVPTAAYQGYTIIDNRVHQ